MFDYKNITSKIFYLALLTILGWQNLNEVSAKVVRTNNISLAEKIKLGRTRVETDLKSRNNDLKPLAIAANNSALHIHPIQQSIENHSNFLEFIANSSDSQLLASQDPTEKRNTIFNLAINSLKRTDNYNDTSFATQIIRIVSISFFLMLLIPFGIFYPLFILYKKLFGVETDDELAEESIWQLNDASFELSKVPVDTVKEYGRNNCQATVSKLQIAFPARIERLRQQLAEVNSSVYLKSNTEMTQLLRKTVSILLDCDRWTHVGQSSISLPLKLVKAKFEVTCTVEKSKPIGQELSLATIKEHSLQQSNSDSQDERNYVVVTLVLCTSHTAPLFEEISTKKQLSKILVQLSKMQPDCLIDFELLWNPLLENKYLSNNELVVNYSEMMRLF